MQNDNVYALLIGVGDYEKMNIANLPTYKMDLTLMGAAIVSGLKVNKDNVRLMAGTDNNGYVSTTDLAMAVSNFKSMIGAEDTFIFYFSGHGKESNLIFSNGQVELQSVVDFINKVPAKNKIMILDCCYSGKFKTDGARHMHFEETITDYVGHGIAVFASSSANEVSRLGPNNNHSMFTGALSTAISLNKRIRKGRLSLFDINEELQIIVGNWNKQNPGKEQQPVFRTSMGGTIYFQVEEYQPYEQMEISRETEAYKIVKVEPLNSLQYKRLCAFVIIKDEIDNRAMAKYSREIAESIKYAEVYSGAASEERFEGAPAKAVWCYFGHDESDIINHLHFCYTIWAADAEMKQLYFKENRHASEVDGIYVYENTDYKMLKKLQEPTMSREEFIDVNKKLLTSIVSMAEQFIVDLQEVGNKTISIETMQERYSDWIIRVKKRYLRLTDGDVAPDDLHDWSAEIENLAGWVLDLSIIIENERHNGELGERELWLIKNAVKNYHESLDKLSILETTTDLD
ncbi:MAG: caspase family protein [Blautia sp.]|nr:caspase family protein [Blautia sp.]